MKKAKNKKIKNSSISKSKNSLSKNLSSEKTKKQKSCFNDFFNKNKSLIIGAIIFLVLLVILLTVQLNSTGNAVTEGETKMSPSRIGCGVKKISEVAIKNTGEKGLVYNGDYVCTFSDNGLNEAFVTIFGILLGQPVYFDTTQNSIGSSVSSLVIIFAIWLMFFISFSDIINIFYVHKNKVIPWVLGLCISTIMAQLGMISSITVWLTGLLGFIGIASVYASLGIAFVAFFALNLGIKGPFEDWAERKRIKEEKTRAKTAEEFALIGQRYNISTGQDLAKAGETIEKGKKVSVS